MAFLSLGNQKLDNYSMRARKPEGQKARKPESQKARKPEAIVSGPQAFWLSGLLAI